MSKAEEVRSAIDMARQMDLEWMRKREVGRDDQRFLPWMPFSWPEFISLVAEALPEMHGTRFLDVGCGPGSRMLLARDIFGLDVQGIDRVPEYVQAATGAGFNVTCEDALEYKNYGDFDFVWMNRPIRDKDLQARLDWKIYDDMRPGAVVGVANLDSRPPLHWYTVYDDWEVKRGVWQKP